MELNNSVGWNDSRYPLVSVAQMRPDTETALPTHSHSFDPILKPGNHLPFTEPKGARLVFLDLIATVKKEIVSNVHNTTELGGWSITKRNVFVLDSTTTSFHL